MTDPRPLAIVCDFDGTITTADIGDELCRRRLPDYFPAWERRLAAGELSLLDGQKDIWPRLRISEADFHAFVDEFARFRDGFEGFYAGVLARGIPFVVASNGFSNYIERVFARLNRAPPGPAAPPTIYANRLSFGGAGEVAPAFPFAERYGCGACGVCKGKVVEELKARGFRVAFLGDGGSDRCAAGVADQLFAPAGSGFARWLAARGKPHSGFAHFREVAARLCR